MSTKIKDFLIIFLLCIGFVLSAALIIGLPILFFWILSIVSIKTAHFICFSLAILVAIVSFSLKEDGEI